MNTSFGDSITLGVFSLACPRYLKQQVYNTFAMLQKNAKDEVDFLPADKWQRFLQSGTAILGVCCQACAN